jgi:hypothetical protein
VEDAKGNRSANLGGAGVANIDLVLGQGRVAGQAILKDVGRAMNVRNYTALAAAAPATTATATPVPATAAPTAMAGLSPTLLGGFAVLGLALGGVGFEVGRRRK